MAEAPASSSGASASVGQAEGQAAGGAQHIDVQRLADKVYSLLLADLKLARARADVSARPKSSVRGES